VIPPSTANSTAPSAGQMISPARLDTKKQCSTEPQWTGIRASGASLTAPRVDAAISASISTPPTASDATIPSAYRS
jgi:hypothetical protein